MKIIGLLVIAWVLFIAWKWVSKKSHQDKKKLLEQAHKHSPKIISLLKKYKNKLK